jgi:hypothetical protein
MATPAPGGPSPSTTDHAGCPGRAGQRQQVEAMLAPAVVTDGDEPQHDPSARLARLVDLRDVHCCGPGCSSSRTSATTCCPTRSGPTSAANLVLESPRCHHAKHNGWTLERHPDGSTTWRSPLHRHYWRPPPHQPPQLVDLWQEPPPLRPGREDLAPADQSPARRSRLAAGPFCRRDPPAACLSSPRTRSRRR